MGRRAFRRNDLIDQQSRSQTEPIPAATRNVHLDNATSGATSLGQCSLHLDRTVWKDRAGRLCDRSVESTYHDLANDKEATPQCREKAPARTLFGSTSATGPQQEQAQA
jgi:hypothetical protein